MWPGHGCSRGEVLAGGDTGKGAWPCPSPGEGTAVSQRRHHTGLGQKPSCATDWLCDSKLAPPGPSFCFTFTPFHCREADVTCPGSPAGTRQSWDQNPVSRGSRWVHYGPSGSKVARKDLTASRSRGTLGLWGGDEGGAAGRLSGQRQENGPGCGGGGCRRSP